MTPEHPLLIPAGDQFLIIQFGDEIDPKVNHMVHSMAFAINTMEIGGLLDIVPSYRSLMIQYDSTKTSLLELKESILSIYNNIDSVNIKNPSVIHIPVCYGGNYGPDLDKVAKSASLSRKEVINIHSKTDYLVYMIGFTLGFPYLGGLDTRIATPRLPTPRQDVPSGSIGIAENQTGIYSISSPGGWNIIGRTPLKLFDPIKDPPSVLSPGSYVRFESISSPDEFKEIEDKVIKNNYEIFTELHQ